MRRATPCGARGRRPAPPTTRARRLMRYAASAEPSRHDHASGARRVLARGGSPVVRLAHAVRRSALAYAGSRSHRRTCSPAADIADDAASPLRPRRRRPRRNPPTTTSLSGPRRRRRARRRRRGGAPAASGTARRPVGLARAGPRGRLAPVTTSPRRRRAAAFAFRLDATARRARRGRRGARSAPRDDAVRRAARRALVAAAASAAAAARDAAAERARRLGSPRSAASRERAAILRRRTRASGRRRRERTINVPRAGGRGTSATRRAFRRPTPTPAAAPRSTGRSDVARELFAARSRGRDFALRATALLGPRRAHRRFTMSFFSERARAAAEKPEPRRDMDRRALR